MFGSIGCLTRSLKTGNFWKILPAARTQYQHQICEYHILLDPQYEPDIDGEGWEESDDDDEDLDILIDYDSDFDCEAPVFRDDGRIGSVFKITWANIFQSALHEDQENNQQDRKNFEIIEKKKQIWNNVFKSVFCNSVKYLLFNHGSAEIIEEYVDNYQALFCHKKHTKIRIIVVIFWIHDHFFGLYNV